MIPSQRIFLIKRTKKPVRGFLVLFFIAAYNLSVFGQEGWTLSTSLQYSSGNYLYNNSNKLIYFYGGTGYQTRKWSLSLSVPIVAQTAGGVGQVGGMTLPNGNSDESNGNGMFGGSGGSNEGGMMGSGGTSSNLQSMSLQNHFGIGDIYFYGSYYILEDLASPFSVSLNSFVKFPTANSNKGLGTGEFDYGISATVRKTFNDFVAFADLGRIQIGDPANINYKNPMNYGLGVGKFFNNGDYSLLLYYQAYTTIIEGYDAPRLLSLGFNYKTNSVLTLSLIGAVGLSKVTSAFSFSSGLKWNL